MIDSLQNQLKQCRKSAYEVKSEAEFPHFLVQTKRGLMFEHRSFIFPLSYRSCSDTNYSVRWDFRVPGSGRRPRSHFWTLALMVWEVADLGCRFSVCQSVTVRGGQVVVVWGVENALQVTVSRGQWVVWTILGQVVSCSGSALLSRPGHWRRVASLGVETSLYSQHRRTVPRSVISTKTLACYVPEFVAITSQSYNSCKRCEMPTSYYGFCHRSRTVVVSSCLIADDDVRCKCQGVSFVSCELVSLVAIMPGF